MLLSQFLCQCVYEAGLLYLFLFFLSSVVVAAMRALVEVLSVGAGVAGAAGMVVVVCLDGGWWHI
jgi:hypothetical protein